MNFAAPYFFNNKWTTDLDGSGEEPEVDTNVIQIDFSTLVSIDSFLDGKHLFQCKQC